MRSWARAAVAAALVIRAAAGLALSLGIWACSAPPPEKALAPFADVIAAGEGEALLGRRGSGTQHGNPCGCRLLETGLPEGGLADPGRAGDADDERRLIVEAAVIGHDASRWRRRLAGKSVELEVQVREAVREEGQDGARVQSLRQVQDQLTRLEAFALPTIEELAGWPRAATWGEWLDRFARLVPRVLRAPAHVLRVLADLRPMSDVGPIDLDEARRVLVESVGENRQEGLIVAGLLEERRAPN